MLNANRLRTFLIICIVAVTLLKLSLVGCGFFGVTDEFRYTYSGKAIDYLLQGEMKKAVSQIYLAEGRPADVLVKMIPHAFQTASARLFGYELYESKNFYPVFLFNFIIYCFVLLIHYRFSKLVLKDTVPALFSVLLYSVLTNSYIYLRHALPYDSSFLILYTVLYFTARDIAGMTYVKAFFLGVFCFFAYLIYPGYFVLFFAIALFFMLAGLTRQDVQRRLRLFAIYVFGSFCCLSAFELTARLVHTSYIVDAMALSNTITSGSFDESFTFLFKYLIRVETFSGVVLLAGLLLFMPVAVILSRSGQWRQHQQIILFFAVLCSGFLLYASLGYFLHKMVFYGRLLHQYFPFFCLFSLFAISILLNKNLKRTEPAYLILSVALVINFIANFIDYRSYAYPRDVGYTLSKTHDLKKVGQICEYETNLSVGPGANYSTMPYHLETQDSILLVNSCIPFNILEPEKYHIFDPANNYKLVWSAPHYLSFIGYKFEGYGEQERENMSHVRFDLKIYSRNK